MLTEILYHGVGTTTIDGISATAIRVVLGVFFLLSGYHKLFNAQRHAAIVTTMIQDHVPFPWFNCWFVPIIEFSGGMALIVGLLSPLAASGLFVICLVATLADGLKRIKAWKPLDDADYADDVLYLPEVLYCVMLVPTIIGGAGPYSMDALIYRMVNEPLYLGRGMLAAFNLG